jgi:methionine--tRNA ligase beta chain
MTDIDLDLVNLENRVNNELVSNLANLFYRVLSFLNRYHDSQTATVLDRGLLEQVRAKCESVGRHYDNIDFRDAVREILEISSMGNKYFQDNAPWELVKSDEARGRGVLTDCVNIVKNLTILVKPIMPLFAEKMEKQLGLPALDWGNMGDVVENHRIGRARIVLKKIEPIVLRTRDEAQGERYVEFSIDDKLAKAGVDVKLATVRGVSIRKSDGELEKLKKHAEEEIRGLSVEGDPVIEGYREVYRRFRADVEPSMVHLISLVKEKGMLPNINTVVDAYNIVSATRRVSVGVHDLDRVVGGVRLAVTRGDEVYVPLGETEQAGVKPGEFAMVDDEHVLCHLDSKQGQHTKIGFDTRNLLVYVQGNAETSGTYLDAALREICDLITRFNGGSYRLLNPTDLSALNLKVGRVTEVLDHPGADKLYILKVDLGSEERQLCAGLKPYYPDRGDLLGKNLVVLTNLQPARLRGELSEGMLLAGDDGRDVGVLNPQRSKPGDQVYVGDVREYKEDPVTFDQFMKYRLEAVEGRAYMEGLPLHTDTEDVTLEKVRDGRIR